MLGRGKGGRAYQHRIVLTMSEAVVDDFGHASFGTPVAVCEAYASISQMSAAKTLATFQQADYVGLDIEFRTPAGVTYNGIQWRGHDIHFAHPEDADSRGRITRIQGWYQEDAPAMV